MSVHSLLIIDDEPSILKALERLFRPYYTVYTAGGGIKALELLKRIPISLIISDQRMKEMTGVEVLEESIGINPHCIRILLTGYSDIKALEDAINLGKIYQYVTKPWENDELLLMVKKALEVYDLRFELQEKNRLLQKKNSELAKAIEELKVLDKAKDSFIGLVSHELRTPLMSMMGYSESLETIVKGDEGKRMLNRMEASIARLNVIIQDVLDVVILESGKVDFNMKLCDLSNIIKESLRLLENDISLKSLTVKFKSVKSLLVKVDHLMIHKVCYRLLHNAIKFSKKKGAIEVSFRKSEGFIEVLINDSGPGIDSSYQPYLFERFRLAQDIYHHSQGLGLSLPICKSIIERHGGNIGFKNKKESGCEFFFTLPVEVKS